MSCASIISHDSAPGSLFALLPIPTDTHVAIDAVDIDAAGRAMSENSWRALRASTCSKPLSGSAISAVWCMQIGKVCRHVVSQPVRRLAGSEAIMARA